MGATVFRANVISNKFPATHSRRIRLDGKLRIFYSSQLSHFYPVPRWLVGANKCASGAGATSLGFAMTRYNTPPPDELRASGKSECPICIFLPRSAGKKWSRPALLPIIELAIGTARDARDRKIEIEPPDRKRPAASAKNRRIAAPHRKTTVIIYILPAKPLSPRYTSQ